jgi:hypothetical protein
MAGAGGAPDGAGPDAGVAGASGTPNPDGTARDAAADADVADTSNNTRDAGDAGSAGDTGGAGDASAALSCGEAEAAGPEGRCYALVPTLLSWASARANCQTRGAGWDLAAVDGAVVSDFLGVLLTFEAWMGASDLDVEGTWTWVIDGSAFWSGNGETGGALNAAYSNWNGVEPNGGDNSDCLRLVPSTGDPTIGTWADLECAELRGSVCEGPPS